MQFYQSSPPLIGCLGILRAYSEKETVTAKEKPPPAVPVHIYFTISPLKWCDSHSDAVVA